MVWSGKQDEIFFDPDIGYKVLEIVPPDEPSLTRTCRQLRAEALPVFYGSNVFRHATDDKYCQDLLTWLTPEKRLMLKNVRFSGFERQDPRPPDEWLSTFEPKYCVSPCVSTSARRIGEINATLQRMKYFLSDGVVHVAVRLKDTGPLEWMSKPEGKCEVGGCCGKAIVKRKLTKVDREMEDLLQFNDELDFDVNYEYDSGSDYDLAFGYEPEMH